MRDSKPDARSKTTRPIRRQTLAAAVAERLRQQIINGELNEGAQLRPDALAEQFAVSRLPVREALLRLEAEGLINVMANRGAVVSALSPEEIGELFEIRAVLECHILREAVPRLTAERLLDAERILNEYEQAVEEEWDLSSWEELNWRFHSSLYAAAGRPMLMSLLKLLNNNCGRYTRLHLLVTRRLHWAGKAHRAILDVCRTGNADEASEVLWGQIIEAGRYLQEFIQTRRDKRRDEAAPVDWDTPATMKEAGVAALRRAMPLAPRVGGR